MATSKKLQELRDSIDAVDTELIELLTKRSGYVLEVGETKTEQKSAFHAPDRERRVYERLCELNNGPLPDQAIRNIYREIMSASLALENPLKIAFLGPKATFTHQAAMNHFGLSGEFLPKTDISDVFDDVERGRAEYGVVPVENTSEGAVSRTLDKFVESDLKICAEVMLEVSLSLLNKTGKAADIETVCSHPHALAQVAGWLKKNMAGVTLKEVSSTALAAKIASEDNSIAAVASNAAKSLYDLHAVEEKIEDSARHLTRFLVIGDKTSAKTGSDKTSIVFAIKDAPGALYKMLEPFATRGINLTKIESRPRKTKTWEYMFFVDMDGHLLDDKISAALTELEGMSKFFKALGSYPKS